jgi:Domain of unknown function (DU1801)
VQRIFRRHKVLCLYKKKNLFEIQTGFFIKFTWRINPMAKNKTTETTGSVSDFLNAVADESKRTDSFMIAELMQHQTGMEPKMWGPAIVGFGRYHYKYDSGHEGDAPLIAFSPRANAISLYMCQFDNREDLLRILGKHKMAKACIYIKKLSDIDIEVFKQMITEGFEQAKILHA